MFPVVYNYNRCIKCGREGTIKTFDLKGKQTLENSFRSQVSYGECIACHQKYSLIWDCTLNSYRFSQAEAIKENFKFFWENSFSGVDLDKYLYGYDITTKEGDNK